MTLQFKVLIGVSSRDSNVHWFNIILYYRYKNVRPDDKGKFTLALGSRNGIWTHNWSMLNVTSTTNAEPWTLLSATPIFSLIKINLCNTYWDSNLRPRYRVVPSTLPLPPSPLLIQNVTVFFLCEKLELMIEIARELLCNWLKVTEGLVRRRRRRELSQKLFSSQPNLGKSRREKEVGNEKMKKERYR